jgi:Flp pilus assembly protein TadG
MFILSALPRRLAPILRFPRAKSGVAALEFALILPLMLSIYLGSVEVTDGLSVKRKLSHAASAISDLVAQDTAIANTAEMQDIFDAGTAILSPFSATSMKMTVTAITMDATKKATVSWAQTLNGATCPAKGSAVTVPADLQSANGFLILVRAEYPYKPTIGYVLSGTIDIKDQLYQAPRSGKAIPGPSCG